MFSSCCELFLSNVLTIDLFEWVCSGFQCGLFDYFPSIYSSAKSYSYTVSTADFVSWQILIILRFGRFETVVMAQLSSIALKESSYSLISPSSVAYHELVEEHSCPLLCC